MPTLSSPKENANLPGLVIVGAGFAGLSAGGRRPNAPYELFSFTKVITSFSTAPLSFPPLSQ
jgi:hypothetical protein